MLARQTRMRHVVVAGGGPAGTALAIELRRRRLDVTVLERTDYGGFRIGETLPPQAQSLLAQLGAWEAFQRDGHAPSPGIVSLWGEEAPYENDFIFNPYGHGWHLDRAKFDARLAELAELQGARVCRQTVVRRLQLFPDGQVMVEAETPQGPTVLAADFVVDATGRAASVAQKLGSRPLALDALVAVIAAGRDGRLADQRTFLEAAPHGWWYAAKLPSGQAIVAYFTDAPRLPRRRQDLQRAWSEELAATKLIGKMFGAAVGDAELRTVAAPTARLAPGDGPNWLAVGDAAMSFDPLSSAGISFALESAERAADAIAQSLLGEAEGLAAYRAWLDEIFARYLEARTYYYRQVVRWPDSDFWARRQALPSAGPLPALPTR